MANSSTKSLLLSSTSSLIIDVISALLDDDERDETERFHVTTFETCCAVSTKTLKISTSGKHYDWEENNEKTPVTLVENNITIAAHSKC
jgi:hypothetical protein